MRSQAVYSQPSFHGISAPPAGMPASMLANFFIGLAVFAGGFVFRDPAPYELMLAAMLALSFLFGMRVPRTVLPVLVCFALYATGGVISSFQIDDVSRGLIYVAISFFMGLTATFFAIVIGEDKNRLRLIFRWYVVAAFLTSILGILGYFGVSGFGIFTRYDRAMGAFQDPNVFAPFLVAPILYLINGVMNRSATLLPLRAGVLLVLVMALFLAFSRAAWGLAVFSIVTFYFMLLVNEQKAKTRLKYIVLAVVGLVSVVIMFAIALQFDVVADLFKQRFQVVQEYDGGEGGRFSRHLDGFALALERPLGIAPLEFGYIFGEDPHNNFVKALMAYGWLGFFAWVTITVWTLVVGFKLNFRPRPWQVYHQIAYTVFAGHCLVGNVIDTNHWRHYYLMIGIVWGCVLLEKRWQKLRALGSARSAAAAPVETRKTRARKGPGLLDTLAVRAG